MAAGKRKAAGDAEVGTAAKKARTSGSATGAKAVATAKAEAVEGAKGEKRKRGDGEEGEEQGDAAKRACAVSSLLSIHSYLD